MARKCSFDAWLHRKRAKSNQFLWISPKYQVLTLKGQLISKANFKVVIGTKKQTKYFCISALASISGQINEM